jgi:hypothetical protein
MTLSAITKEILKAYNPVFDENEATLKKLEENVTNDLENNQLKQKYDSVIGINKKIENQVPEDDSELIDPVKKILDSKLSSTKFTNIEICNICKINFINDKSFVKKIMEYRAAEIKKKLVFIKKTIELYKYIITSILYLKYKISLNTEDRIYVGEINSKIEVLKIEKETTKSLIEKYVLDSERYIINTTICKYRFLNEYYNKFLLN